MRFVHTADWHLGRLFHGIHLTEDQALILRELIAILRGIRPDGLIIAGDIYDRAVPPPEAVQLLDDVISEIVLGLRIPVILIAGNHDSPDRLAFGSRLLAAQGLHVHGPLRGRIEPVVLGGAAAHGGNGGPVYFYPVPYAETAVARESLGDASILDADAAMKAVARGILDRHPRGCRGVFIGHAFIAGGEESESERPLSIGGSAAVQAETLAGFHYAALGHLHRPQTAGSGPVHYAGSILKYSFSEAGHAKSVQLVEMDRNGACRLEKIPLVPRRDLRRLEGTLEDILRDAAGDARREDYIQATLLDRGPILDAMGKIRRVYPNCLHLERPALQGRSPSDGGSLDPRRAAAGNSAVEEELFAAFYREATGQPLSAEQAGAFASIAQALQREEREAGT